MTETFGDWELKRGKVGWLNPPPGCKLPTERYYGLYKGAADVFVWIENGSVQLLDDMDYYPVGCYSVPLGLVLRLMELT